MGTTKYVACPVCEQLVGQERETFQLCSGALSPLYRAPPAPTVCLSLSDSRALVVPRPHLPFVPGLVFLESPALQQWPKWMGETRWGGKRTLASEGSP